MTKQIHLAAHFPGVNNTTVWSDPGSGSQTDFDSFVHFAQTAERGLFDMLFLADSAAARQLGIAPTGHAVRGVSGAPGAGPSNLVIQAGPRSRDEMIGGIANGILVTELIGQGVNGVTGDYSRGAAGFLIVDGEIGLPVAYERLQTEFDAEGELVEPRPDAGLRPVVRLEVAHGTSV